MSYRDGDAMVKKGFLKKESSEGWILYIQTDWN
jgi:hypothetical protein